MAKTCIVAPCFKDSRFSLEGCAGVTYCLTFQWRKKKLKFSLVTLYKAIISDVK